VESLLAQDPRSGALFVFVNRRRDRVKILAFEGDGYSIYYKRLEIGVYRLPEAAADRVEVSRAELAMLLEGIVPRQLDRRYNRT
jgi:transposase